MKSIDRFEADIIKGYYIDGKGYGDDAEKIPGVRKEFHSLCTLEATAATNGFKGGDSGHGSRTIVRFVDLGGTDIKVFPILDNYSNGGVEIHLGGDCELSMMIEALRFAADTLEELSSKQ